MSTPNHEPTEDDLMSIARAIQDLDNLLELMKVRLSRAKPWQRQLAEQLAEIDQRLQVVRMTIAMSRDDIEVLAADCGLSPSQFRDMMKRGPRAADELLELMKVLDIDEARLKAVNRGALNNMKLICAECGRKSECRGSLRRGTASRAYRTFCSNSELLDDARRLRPTLVA